MKNSSTIIAATSPEEWLSLIRPHGCDHQQTIYGCQTAGECRSQFLGGPGLIDEIMEWLTVGDALTGTAVVFRDDYHTSLHVALSERDAVVFHLRWGDHLHGRDA